MRKISKSILTVSLLSPFSVYALGIGDITTQSGLNQVLRAQIPLVGSQSEDPSNIRVALASPEAFAKAGLDRPYFLSTLKFTPVLESDGSITVKVSSEDRIKEPFVNFLLEVEWPKGTTMREFTILLDPPVTLDAVTTPLQTIPVAKSAPVSEPAKGASLSYATPAASQAVAQAMPDHYGPVKKNDNIWQIAGRLIEGDTITREQMMLALYERNPKAFYKDNVNALMRGAVLDIPERDAILNRSPAQAKSEFNEQNRLWSSSNQSSSASSSTAKSSDASPASDSNEPEAQLKLLTPTDGDTEKPEVTVQGGSVDTPTGSTDPNVQANMAMEMATSLEQENAEFRTRLDELETQVTQLQKLIALKDEQLAQLQASPAEPAAAKPAAPKPTPKPVPQPVAEEETPIALYAGGAIVLALLGWLFTRRRKSTDEGAPVSRKPATSTKDDTDDSLAPSRGPELPATSQPIEVEESTLLSEFTASEFDDLADQQSADPLTETDVYIAYGRYQQAEDLMMDALNDDPDNKVYQLKLLDIYFAAGKAAEFETYAKSIRHMEHTDPDTWEQIVTMGSELCPDSELFGGTSDFISDEEPEDLTDEPQADEFSLEIDKTEETDTPPDLEAPAEEKHEIEFETPDMPDVSEFEDSIETTKEPDAAAETEDTAPKSEKDDFEFDFDLIQPDTSDAASDSAPEDDDEATTKLALVQAYIDMEDLHSARETLEEVIAIGNDEQKAKAQALLEQLSE